MSSCDARTSRRTTSPDPGPADAGTNARPETSITPPSAAITPRGTGSETRCMATSVPSGDRSDRLPVRFAVAVPDPSRRNAHRDAEPTWHPGDPSLRAGVITGRDGEGLAVAGMHLDDRAHDGRRVRPRAEA